MLKFLKNFGLGLLYVLLFPVILAGVVVFALIGFVSAVIEVFAIIVRFVKGEKIFPPYPEDVKAQEILAKNYGLKEEQPAPAPQPAQNVYVQQNYYPNPQMMPGQNPAFGQPLYQQMPPYMGQPAQQQNPYLGQENAPQQLPPKEENPYRTNLNLHAIGSNASQEPDPVMIERQQEEDPFSAETFQKGEDDE